jgi:hypothetical protein
VSSDAWKAPTIKLDPTRKHPRIACSSEELARLQSAFRSNGPEKAPVANAVAAADKALAEPLEFPPRGGQHNQWYQCDACQLGLKTIDDTHHECPKCKKVYSGEPYDDVIFGRKHERNIRRACDAAWAYAITGEAKYAQFAAKVLLGYAERYLSYPYHNNACTDKGTSGGHLYEQTLNESASLAHHIAPTYDLICSGSAIPEADRKTIAEKLIVPMLENLDRHKAGKSNWQTWHNAAMTVAGAALGDEAWVRKAIEDPKNGFEFQMQVSVSRDGMWYENSWGYHFYSLDGLVRAAEAARHAGIDLWSAPPLKKMCLAPLCYLMPNGNLPRFGDDVETKLSTNALEYAFAAYKEPLIQAHLPQKPSWASVLLGRDTQKVPEASAPPSAVFEGAGHAILRTSGGLAAVLAFGPPGGFHGHFDKLSFVWYGGKQELGVDPGRAASQAYRLPIHGNWYRATVSHNAIVVDGRSQAEATGQLEFFAANEKYAAVMASCGAAYPGVSQRRVLAMTPTYLLVFDVLQSQKERRFDWLYHSRGSSVRCDSATAEAAFPEKFQGAAYIQNAKQGATKNPVRAEFACGALKTWLTAAAAPDTTVLVGDGPGASIQERVPLAMITRQGKSATFAVVLEPADQKAKAEVSAVSVSNDGRTVTVERGAAKDVFEIGARDLKIIVDGKVVLQKLAE